jgi:O-acetylhomoserine/O-acetylserine sulfhydrylase-like pyridoxal-dependent enzyme
MIFSSISKGAPGAVSAATASSTDNPATGSVRQFLRREPRARSWSRQSIERLFQGLETLPLRIERHCDNTQAVADFLAKQRAVTIGDARSLAIHPASTTH